MNMGTSRLTYTKNDYVPYHNYSTMKSHNNLGTEGRGKTTRNFFLLRIACEKVISWRARKICGCYYVCEICMRTFGLAT
jgi:hypothetical protein